LIDQEQFLLVGREMKVELFLIFWVIYFARASEDEFRLLQDLRKDYDIVERPVVNHKKPINVKLRLYLQQILEIVSFLRRIIGHGVNF
jgi:hypothetical protein